MSGRTAVVVLVLAASLGTSGCGVLHGADDLARAAGGRTGELAGAAGRGADEAADLGAGVAAQVDGVAGAGVAVAGAVDQDAAALLAPHVGDLPDQDRALVVRAACTASDVADIAEADGVGDAAERALVASGGRAALRSRAAGLAEDLAAAESAGDAAGKIAVAAVCGSV